MTKEHPFRPLVQEVGITLSFKEKIEDIKKRRDAAINTKAKEIRPQVEEIILNLAAKGKTCVDVAMLLVALKTPPYELLSELLHQAIWKCLWSLAETGVVYQYNGYFHF